VSDLFAVLVVDESGPGLSKQYITIVAVLGVVGLAIILLVIISAVVSISISTQQNTPRYTNI